MTSDSLVAKPGAAVKTAESAPAQHVDPSEPGLAKKVDDESSTTHSSPKSTTPTQKPALFRPSNRAQEKSSAADAAGTATAEGRPADDAGAQTGMTRDERGGRAAAAVDWSESKLPALFGCHNTAATATSAPIPFHTAWDLYADDHSGGSVAAGSPAGTMSFDPVFIATVADVQSFWRLWRYVTPPSSSRIPFTYSWFRHDIKPEWEHPRNKKGGTIMLIIFDRDRPGLNDKTALDDAFMAALVGAVGESFAEGSSTLNGLMLKLRQNKPVTLQLWTSHSEVSKLKAFSNSVRDALGKIIGTKPLQKLEYFSHHQKQTASGSLAARMKAKTKATPDHIF